MPLQSFFLKKKKKERKKERKGEKEGKNDRDDIRSM